MKTKIALLLLTACASFQLSAQSFEYQAKIAKVTTQGYHAISLSPELLGQSNLDLSNIRITDEAGNELPYVIRQETESLSNSSFHPYKIIKKMLAADTISQLIFHNPERNEIDNLSLIVKNTSVQKRARLSGSNDQENWFLIKDDYVLYAMENPTETTELKMLDFPLSNYEYFRLDINDTKNLPINIVKIGYYEKTNIAGEKTEFQIKSFTQKDSAKLSLIHVNLAQASYFENLQLDFSGAALYRRSAEFQLRTSHVNRRKEKIHTFVTQEHFNLSSSSSNSFALRPTLTSSFWLKIHNEDNKPLHLEKITASYLSKYAIVELAPDQQYYIKIGDESFKKANYDLAGFMDKISIEDEVISHEAILPVEAIQEETPDDDPMPNYIIWIIIGLVGAGIGIVSIKAIKEMSSEKE